MANPVNSTFDVAFCQHEPGSQCTTFMDLSFGKNLRSCQRFYAKSFGYSQTIAAGYWRWIGVWSGTTTCRLDCPFPVEMAKTPTVILYPSGPTANQVYIDMINGNAPVGSVGVNSAGINYATLSTSQGGTAPQSILGYWVADTGI